MGDTPRRTWCALAVARRAPCRAAAGRSSRSSSSTTTSPRRSASTTRRARIPKTSCDDLLDIDVTNQGTSPTSRQPDAFFSGLSNVEGAHVESNPCPTSLAPAATCTIRISVRFQTSHGVRMHVNAGSHVGSLDIGSLD